MLEKNVDLKQLLLLLVLKNEGPIGRYRLDDMLYLPEGVVRGLLLKLSKEGYISAGKPGCQLTNNGRALLSRLLAKYGVTEIKEFEEKSLKIAEKHIAVQVKGKAEFVKSAMKHRDIAVRACANGAIILTYSRGVLSIPNVYSNLTAENPKLAERITQAFKMEEGDLIILSGAENKWRALEGSLAIVLSLTQP